MTLVNKIADPQKLPPSPSTEVTDARKKTRRGYLDMLLIKGSAAGVLFAAQLVPARCLNDLNLFGVYSYVLSVLTILTFVVIWGTDRLCLKEVSLWRKQNDKEDSGTSVGRRLFGVYTVVGINLILASIFLYFYLPAKLEDDYATSILLMAVLILLGRTVARISSSITKGLDSVVFSEFAFSLLRPVIFVSLAGLLYLCTSKQTVTQFLLLFGISFVAVFVVTAVRNFRNKEIRIQFAPDQISPIYQASFFFFLIGIGLPMMDNINTISLGNIRELDEVGLYSAAARICAMVLLGLVSANLMISPKLSPLFEKGKFAEIYRLVRGNNAFIAALTVIPVVIILLFAEPLLRLFGDKFLDAAPILRILIIGQIVNVCCGPVMLTATLCGMQRVAAAIVIFACGINWLFCLILIPQFGANGAAWASVIGIIASNVSLLLVIYIKTGINLSILNLLKPSFGK